MRTHPSEKRWKTAQSKRWVTRSSFQLINYTQHSIAPPPPLHHLFATTSCYIDMSASKKEKAAAGTPKLTGFKGWRRVSPKEAQTIADAAMDLSSAISQSPPAKKKLSLGKAATAWSKHQKQLKSHKKQQQQGKALHGRHDPRAAFVRIGYSNNIVAEFIIIVDAHIVYKFYPC